MLMHRGSASSVLVLLAGVCAALSLAACSPSAPTTTPEQPAATTGAPAAPAAAPAAAVEPIALEIKDAAGAAMTGDPARGGQLYAQCRTCHAVEAGVNKIGPTLHGLIGRHTGAVEGFRYSDANKAANLVWSEQQLFDYLENPRKVIPGTTMAFVGMRDAQQRADLIAYLKQNTK